MKRTFPLLFAICLSTLLSADEANKYTREEMVAILERQEEYVDQLTDEFFTINEDIETRIENVVNAMASYTDSADTKTRVSRLKSKVLNDLKTSIRNLQQQRNVNAATMARLPSNRVEGSTENRANEYLDGKIKTRVDQVMLMANSLYESKDVKKYDYVVKEKFNDNYKVKKRTSDEWKKNRQQTINADLDRKHLLEDIEKAEHRLTQQINHIKAEQKSLGGRPLTEAQAKVLADKEELLAIVQEKKVEVIEGGKKVKKTAVDSTKDAMELEDKVDIALNYLRMANDELRQKGMELKHGLALLDAQQRALRAYDAQQND